MAWTYRCEYVRCGNDRCRSCPHGPYWYRYQHAAGRMRKEYVGKTWPDGKRGDCEPGPHPWAAMLSRETASRELAKEILTWDGRTATLQSAYRAACLRFHPDRGGTDFQQCCVSAAYTYAKNS